MDREFRKGNAPAVRWDDDHSQARRSCGRVDGAIGRNKCRCRKRRPPPIRRRRALWRPPSCCPPRPLPPPFSSSSPQGPTFFLCHIPPPPASQRSIPLVDSCAALSVDVKRKPRCLQQRHQAPRVDWGAGVAGGVVKRGVVGGRWWSIGCCCCDANDA